MGFPRAAKFYSGGFFYTDFAERHLVEGRHSHFVVIDGGLGSRFLPATNAMPNELLPVIDKPVIQYAIEEPIRARITKLVCVTGRTKRAIEDHFDANPELESALEARGKAAVVREIIPAYVTCNFTLPPWALGLGYAFSRAAIAGLLANKLIASKVVGPTDDVIG